MSRLENARIEELKKKERYDNLGKVNIKSSHLKKSSLEIVYTQSVLFI